MKKFTLLFVMLFISIMAICQNPVLLKDVFPGSTGSGIQQIVKTSNYTFFNAEDDDADADRGLYRTDGTPAGTIKLNLSYQTFISTRAEKLTALGNKIVFAGNNFPNYGEIWSSDGTQAGTVALESFQPTQPNVAPVKELAAMGSNVFYSIVDGSNHALLKKTDGTLAGTSLVYDFSAFAGIPEVVFLTPINGILYFVVYDAGGTGVDQIWRTDGTTAGTYMIYNFGVNQYLASYLMVAGNNFYLMIVTPGTGNVLWKSDGTAAGTFALKTIGTTGNNNYPAYTAIGSTLYFAGLDASGKELWKTDGTTAGTVMVADINAGVASSNPSFLTVLNNNIYFAASSAAVGNELWKYDGVNATLVKDINPGIVNSAPGPLVLSNNTIVFRATTHLTDGTELWITDGTSANTLLISNINPGSASSSPNFLTPGNPVYFSANNGINGAEIFKYDNSEGINGLRKIYVNDNSTAADVFTTTVGNNNNTGTRSSPVATLSYALIIAAAGDTIVVDAGTYAEQVIIDKGITIEGAGQNLTYFIPPSTPLVPAPGPFTEIGLFETTQGIGDVHIRNLSVNSIDGSSQNIIIQSGGSVSNCSLLNGGQGIFFRIESATKKALIENNIIQPNGIGINCQGSGLTAIIRNNNISKPTGFYAGIFAGLDFGALPQLTIQNNIIQNYFGEGILAASNNGNYTQNSIFGSGTYAINRHSNRGNTPNATCNWFGSTDAGFIASKISGTVNYTPFLTSGIDNSPAIGFQPVNAACSGRNIYYVNDNSLSADVFTSAIGSNSNNGSASAPFATISYALTQAAANDYIYVDAGTFTEQVTTDKGITITGAGQNLTSILKPAVTIAPPAVPPSTFAEQGVIQTAQSITGDVHISNLSVTGDFSVGLTPIIIQTGGSVKNCKLQNGNQGIFVRIDPAIVLDNKTFVLDGNTINAEYIAVNFAGGNRLTATLSNNTLATFNLSFSTGVFAGTDFGTLVGLTATGNIFSSYANDGLFVNTNNGIISQNSFLGSGLKAINKFGGSTINATCNWYGSADATVVVPKLSTGVTFSPWLVSGTDNSTFAGFQPVPGSCTGRQNKFYVNDNSNTGDVFTTAVGNDNNGGVLSAPLATISNAILRASAGDTIYVDAGNYATPNIIINKSVTILGPNYTISPNNSSDKLLANSGRNAEAIISGSTFTVSSNDVGLEGLWFNPGTKSQVILTNTGFNNFNYKKNYSKITSGNFITLTGPAIPNSQTPVFGNHLIGDNRFEKTGTTSGGICITVAYLNNVSVNNNVFVAPAPSLQRSLVNCYAGFGGIATNFIYSNNISQASNYDLFSFYLASGIIENNTSLHSQRSFFIQTAVPGSSAIQIKNNYLETDFAITSPLNYLCFDGALAGSTANVLLESNTVIQNPAGRNSVAGACRVQMPGTSPNATITIKSNKFTFNGNYGLFTSSAVAGISLFGKLQTVFVENNELTFNGTNLTNTAPTNAPSSPGIYLSSDGGVANAIPSNAVMNFSGNKISNFKQSISFYDGSAIAPNTYVGYGNLPAAVMVNINNNSFTGDSISINNGAVGEIINATCNWYGSSAAQNVTPKITETTVNHSPWLTNGTDNNAAIGFQPVANSCTGVPLDADITLAINVTCNAAANGSIDVLVEEGLAPFTYAWSKDDVAGFSTTEDLDNLAPGNYQLIVTDANGSVDIVFTTITEPDLLTATAAGTNNICFGASAGTATVATAGGTTAYTYSWSNGAATEDITDLAAGIYYVTVTDANGCTAISSYEVTQPTQVTAVATGVSTACSNSASVVATGGTGAYTYLWSNGATTNSLSNIASGTYSVTVTDANGCTALASITVTGNEAFNPSAQVTDVSCFGGSNGIITITNVNGQAPFQYSINGQPSQGSNIFNNLAAGTYTITVVDANGCAGFVTKTILQPTQLTVVLNNVQSTCFGFSTGAITVTAAGGSGALSFSWSGPGGYASSKGNINNLATGSYSLIVTDNNGCTLALGVAVLTFNTITVSSAVSNPPCRGQLNGAIDLTVAGGTGSGFNYAWSNAATSQDIVNLAAGNYTVTITDIGSGCVITQTITVTQPAAALSLAAGKTNATGCSSLGTVSATGSGGTAPYQFKLDNGNYQASGAFGGLYGGSYTVWVKDFNGCTTSKVVAITDNGTDQYESNNSKTQAKTITIGSNISARIALATDVADWFKFTTSAGAASYTISMSHPTINYTFNLYAAGNNTPAMVPASTSTGTKTYILAGNATYSISVTGGLSFNCYQLSATTPLTVKASTTTETNKVVNDEPVKDDLQTSVFPNPHQGNFSMQIISPEDGKARIELFNVSGQKLAEKTVLVHKGKNNLIPFTGMRAGTIFFRVQLGKWINNGKVIGIN